MAVNTSATRKWGIYNSGDVTPALLADSCVSVEVSKEYRIPDYQVEPGAFINYDKVERPGEYRVVLAQGVNDTERKSFLDALDTITASMDLYDVVTPEKVYVNVNVERYNYKRTAHHGVSLIVAELVLQQILVVGAATFSVTNTRSPNGADPVNSGNPQTTAPTQAQIDAANASPDLNNPRNDFHP